MYLQYLHIYVYYVFIYAQTTNQLQRHIEL
jgi:hypothetical protein